MVEEWDADEGAAEGESRRRVETVVVGSPDRPTRVPRRVWRDCDGERLTERREYGLPRTSKTASRNTNCERVLLVDEWGWYSPGVDAELGVFSITPEESDDGAACI